MVIVVRSRAPKEELDEILAALAVHGVQVHLSEGVERTIIGVIGDKSKLHLSQIEALPGVEKIVPIMESYKLASRTFRPEGSMVVVKGRKIGGKELAIMAGPCAVESEEQIMVSAHAAKLAGAQFLRGGAFKPRTSPYAFQGLEKEGLIYMRRAADATGLLVVSEITSENDIDLAIEFIDIIQIGARNAQNYRLLKEAGKSGVPVLLKRGIAQTIEEWLGSAEYIMSEGNYNIIMCERGIRTFETATRNTLDLSAIPVLKGKTHLPVIVDPSHAAGRVAYVAPLSRAAIAAGADGLIVEMHPDPRHAISDASQQLTPTELVELCKVISKMAPLLDREFICAE